VAQKEEGGDEADNMMRQRHRLWPVVTATARVRLAGDRRWLGRGLGPTMGVGKATGRHRSHERQEDRWEQDCRRDDAELETGSHGEKLCGGR
jgi:hypothetical protein